MPDITEIVARRLCGLVDGNDDLWRDYMGEASEILTTLSAAGYAVVKAAMDDDIACAIENSWSTEETWANALKAAAPMVTP